MNKALYIYIYIYIHTQSRPTVVMDVIKMEPEVEPLAVRSCDDAVAELANPSPDEGTSLGSKDSSCDFKWEVKIEETSFPVLKCEPEEETFGMVRVKQENTVEIVTIESEVLTQSH
ncbi:uncharacterized protein [Periplaneta americana]|uniref:uncharacterized protein isoform X3 n=1 Tax=Periplaneta americana TaxID=6978 RepID=UPI0037E9C5D8